MVEDLDPLLADVVALVVDDDDDADPDKAPLEDGAEEGEEDVVAATFVDVPAIPEV